MGLELTVNCPVSIPHWPAYPPISPSTVVQHSGLPRPVQESVCIYDVQSFGYPLMLCYQAEWYIRLCSIIFLDALALAGESAYRD